MYPLQFASPVFQEILQAIVCEGYESLAIDNLDSVVQRGNQILVEGFEMGHFAVNEFRILFAGQVSGHAYHGDGTIGFITERHAADVRGEPSSPFGL